VLTVNNKINNEVINRIITDDLVENKKARTFKTILIISKMEGKHLILSFPIFLSVIISNMIFSRINVNYSSIYEGKNSFLVYDKINIHELKYSDFRK